MLPSGNVFIFPIFVHIAHGAAACQAMAASDMLLLCCELWSLELVDT